MLLLTFKGCRIEGACNVVDRNGQSETVCTFSFENQRIYDIFRSHDPIGLFNKSFKDCSDGTVFAQKFHQAYSYYVLNYL